MDESQVSRAVWEAGLTDPGLSLSTRGSVQLLGLVYQMAILAFLDWKYRMGTTLRERLHMACTLGCAVLHHLGVSAKTRAKSWRLTIFSHLFLLLLLLLLIYTLSSRFPYFCSLKRHLFRLRVLKITFMGKGDIELVL